MGYISFNQIIDAVSGLDKEQQELLLKILQETISPLQPSKKAITNLIEIRENRFNKGLKCIYCASPLISHFGKYRGRQRYRCKSCRRTFNDLSGTPIHGTQYLEKWGKYLECMIEGHSVRKCAKLLKITTNTAFAWRHKILHAISLIPADKLQGIIETDETYELFSVKGSRSHNQKPRKRGGVAGKRGISKEQVCILVARDRFRNTSCQVAGLGRISSEIVKKRIGPQIVPGSIVCSDEEPTLRAFCREAKLTQFAINSQDKTRVINGIYHIQNVNAYHSRYKLWERRFKGIATKYTDNYLRWFNFLDKTSNLENHIRLKQLLLELTSYTMETSGGNFPKYYDSRLSAICA